MYHDRPEIRSKLQLYALSGAVEIYDYFPVHQLRCKGKRNHIGVFFSTETNPHSIAAAQNVKKLI